MILVNCLCLDHQNSVIFNTQVWTNLGLMSENLVQFLSFVNFRQFCRFKCSHDVKNPRNLYDEFPEKIGNNGRTNGRTTADLEDQPPKSGAKPVTAC